MEPNNDPQALQSPQIENEALHTATSHFAIIDAAEDRPHYTYPRKTRDILAIICLAGEFHLTFDSHEITIRERQLAALLPGHVVERYTTSDDFKGYVIISSTSNFESYMPMMSRLIILSTHFKDNPVVSLSDTELATHILFRDLLKQKLRHPDGGMFDDIVINKLLEGIFCETLNIYFKRIENSDVAGRSRRSETLLYQFIALIEQNFASERSVAWYADRLCVTPKHLSSAVKDVSGRTASQWIENYVIDEIKRMLSSTELTIQQISARLKFPNQSFFGKYFKTHTGFSPRQFRSTIAASMR